ncbi:MULTISPECIES: SDR family oxidoreductase [Prauserella salsuginis group]|uniref:NAD(P)-dependent dehydrogenase (Short-subunit alcohol dehydrogenase family) n=2 Tax=Prauserella salsuginis group TaxID=2893672 RepID=A0A839XQK7_9PSEU|nr:MULTISPECIES: SDR family oxidoreductase [Prauserella salsuginis group]MBB3662205.1 NAD(P)-dependent dehydrogenase (short-subunit alcohol dehydrogenase family) [Prauserella sediminis]MCR3719896.1 NAD(P)-dependent dehydrogenase, short-chain alcohol dehydrogenase family [Prauserella flava]MCR3736561.1 NAD(P)-dependent dehydrogenase, short-chain alcohol dehydrogenase family [Prauserella salsuginis]
MAETDLRDKVVVLGGGAKNLGGLLARRLGQLGAKVVVHYHSDASASDAEKTVDEVTAAGGEAVTAQGDLTRVADVRAVFDAAVDRFGRVDVAVNTTGMVLRKPILETTEEEYDRMFAVNSKAAYFFIQEAGRRLSDNGKIISLGTSLLAAFTDGYSTYAGGKAPLEHFTRAAAKEFADRGISVNVVAPGPMDTPFFYPQETPERVEFHKSQAMGNQLTQIEDIVPIILFLATDGWWFTGQTMFPNGGYTTR